MSIEYFGCPTPRLDQLMVAELLDELTRADGYRVVRRTDSDLGLVATNSDCGALETTTISLSPNEIYFGFHSATRDERQRLLYLAHQILEARGYRCDFEEE
jgi:hypothetical protein